LALRHLSRTGVQALVLVLITLLFILLVELSGLAPEREEEPPSAPPETEAPEPAKGQDLPDFSSYDNVDKRKRAFFDFLRPIARSVNEEVRAKRRRLKDLAAELRAGEELARSDRSWVREMADRYRVAKADRPLGAVVEGLLRKVDVIPASLVLAQGAKESAWGRSRFAKEGNNLFGEWCFSEGCGMVPRRRDSGKSHEVEVFPSVRAAVASYVHNLNSHPEYRQLRGIRASLRQAGRPVSGMALAAGLHGYSAQGSDYVASVRAIIRYNRLGKLEEEARGS
jgi:Bax protein